MKGELIVTDGVNGWGNRKSGCEAYGPLGRWMRPEDRPGRSLAVAAHGDLLGDHLDEIGVHEGSPFIVIAATSRFDAGAMKALREDLVAFVASWVEAHGD